MTLGKSPRGFLVIPFYRSRRTSKKNSGYGISPNPIQTVETASIVEQATVASRVHHLRVPNKLAGRHLTFTMKRTGLSTTRFGLATLALSTFIWAAPAGAQSQSTIPQNRDSDVTQLQLSDMNSFLDSHPEIGEQVRKDPTLLENQNFLQSHPALQQFLSTHQRIAQEIRENPQAFMRADDRFDARQDRQGLHSQLVDLDEFLDKHPEVAEQLRKNPSLINDNKWVASHPAFQQFLAEHQQLQNEFRENPSVFMAEEQRYDRREGTRQGMGDRDVNRTE